MWLRYVRRRSPRIGGTPKRDGAPTFLLLILFSWGYVSLIIWGNVSGTLEKHPNSLAVHVLGNVLLALAAGWVRQGGVAVAQRFRDDTLLDALPIHLVARSALAIVDGALLGMVGLATVLSAAVWAHLPPPLWVGLVGLAVLQFLAFFLLAQAAIAWMRVFDLRLAVRSTFVVSIALLMIGFPLSMSGGRLVGSHTVVGMAWLSNAFLHPGVPTLLYAGALLALATGSVLALEAADRVGFDRLHIAGSKRRRSTGYATRAQLEFRLFMRQGGPAVMVLGWVFLIGMGAMVVLLHKHRDEMFPMFAGFAVYLPSIFALNLSGRAMRGDLTARPFLAPLPLAPHDTLDGKAHALRVLLIPFYLSLAVIGGGAAWFGQMTLAYRCALAALGLHAAIDGALSVAFLSNGAGVAGGGGLNLGAQLLMMPLLAIAFSPNWWSTTLALIAVLAVSFEARRAANRAVRWIDDPADDSEHETTVWRALIVMTTFFAIQALSQKALDLATLPPAWQMAASYAAASVVLLLLVVRNRERFPKLRLSPDKPSKMWLWPVAAVAGAASGFGALSLARLVAANADPEKAAADPMASMSVAAAAAMFVVLAIVAPIVEEIFFRGWLQSAIREDLPPAKKSWAFAIGAAAFALAHVGTYGLPQLVLGLIAGALFAYGGGLGPGMLAHAVHNGVVVLFATQAK